MNQHYHDLNTRIDALYAGLHRTDDWYDAEAYARDSDALATLQNERDELLAALLQSGARFTLTHDRALELARQANEQRDNRLWLEVAA